MKTHTWLIGGAGLIAAGLAAFYFYRQSTSASTSTATLQTAQIERGTLTAAVSAAGSIAAPQAATLAWKLAGTVGPVDLQVGQWVTAGQVLMALEPTSYPPSILQARADLLDAQADLADLQAEPTAQQLAQAQLAIIQAQDALTTAQKNLKSVLSPNVTYYQTQLEKAQNALTAAQQNAEINGYQTTLQTAQDALTNAENNLNNIKALDAQYPGYGSQFDRLNKAQAAYDKALQDYQAALYRAEQTQVNDSQSVTSAQDALTTAKANLVAAQSGPNQSQVTLYQAQLATAEANLAAAQAALTDLQAPPTAAALAAIDARMANAEATLATVQLIAPFSGVIVAVENKTGDSVSANEAAVTLADLSTLEIQVSVAEVDINSLVVGQAVNITADAAPNQTFTGTVTAISVLGSSQQGVVTFPVKIVIPKPDPALKPGMTAAVAIVTDEHPNVLLVPNRALRTTNGQRVVNVLFEGQQIQVPVTLGLSDGSYTEILTGQVREGDTVVVNSTTTASTTPRTGFGFGGLFGGGAGPVGGP